MVADLDQFDGARTELSVLDASGGDAIDAPATDARPHGQPDASTPEGAAPDAEGPDARIDATTGPDARTDATTGPDARTDATTGPDARADAATGADASRGPLADASIDAAADAGSSADGASAGAAIDYSFDTDLEGWGLWGAPVSGKDGGVAAVAWTGADGEPNAGALELTAPFEPGVTGESVTILFAPQNLVGKTVTVRVKPRPESGPVNCYIVLQNAGVWGWYPGLPVPVPTTSVDQDGWSTLTYTVSDGMPDDAAKMVGRIALEFGVPTGATPAPIDVLVDSVTAR